jgi:hypothetical protein
MPTDYDGLLTDEERRNLETDALDDEAHQALDSEVHYRIRTYAATPDTIDDETAERIAADTSLLRETGHNGIVSMVEGRLGDHLPDDLP